MYIHSKIDNEMRIMRQINCARRSAPTLSSLSAGGERMRSILFYNLLKKKVFVALAQLSFILSSMYNSFSKHYYSPTYHWCYWSGLCLWWLRWFNGGQLVQDSHSSFAWRALMTIGYWKDWLFQACPQTESNSCRCQLGSLLRGKLTDHKPSFLTKIEWMTFDGLKTLVDLVYEYLICVYYASSSQNIGEVPIHFSYFF